MSKPNQQHQNVVEDTEPTPLVRVNDEATTPVPRGFQSHAAAQADEQARQLSNEVSKRKVLGEVTPIGAAGADAVNEKMVQVIARENIAPFRLGQRTFSLVKNQRTMIPEFVKDHLIEKGKL